jgi:hypothetical protein
MASIRRVNGKITREYAAWKAMKARCSAPCNKHKNYQKKGLIVSEEWINNFEKFLEDMGPCPEGYSLDREENDKGYSKENCRWADDYQQAKNRGSFNLVFSYNGESKVLKDWAKEFGIKYTTFYNRIKRDNVPFEDAINPEFFDNRIEYNGEKLSIKEWSEKLDLPYQVIVDRRRRNWTVERMFEQKVRTKI